MLGFQEYLRPSRSPSQSTTDLHGGPSLRSDPPPTSSSLGVPSHSDPFMDKSTNRSPSLLYPESPSINSRQDSLNIPLLQDSGLDRLEEQHLRVWVAPDLSNPEFQSLLSLFPASISRREVPLFKSASRSKPGIEDLESGIVVLEKDEIKCGTGRMWIGESERSISTMKGGLWDWFVSWWRSIFCF